MRWVDPTSKDEMRLISEKWKPPKRARGTSSGKGSRTSPLANIVTLLLAFRGGTSGIIELASKPVPVAASGESVRVACARIC